MKKTLALTVALMLTLAATVVAQQPQSAPSGSSTDLGAGKLVTSSTLTATPEQMKQMEAMTAPVLTDSQKMQLMLVAKEVQLQQQAAQLALHAAEKAQEQLRQLIAAMTPVGYQMNDKMELVKLPTPPVAGKQ